MVGGGVERLCFGSNLNLGFEPIPNVYKMLRYWVIANLNAQTEHFIVFVNLKFHE